MLAWVVGSGGLLGSSLAAALRSRGATVFQAADVPWGIPGALSVLSADAAAFASAAGAEPWALYWAAGAAVVASSERAVQSELELFTSFLTSLRTGLPAGPGSVFVASSAGAVYAGATNPPFSVDTTTVANSPYGRLKLAQEDAAAAIMGDRVPVVIGRIANLYGPRTTVGKGQGLVFHLCRAAALRRSLNLYVPMQTLRDYVYCDDAADVVVAATERAAASRVSGVRVEVVASGTAMSVASVLSTVERVTHRRVPVALGSDASAARQVLDLRMRPSLPADRTPFATGVRRVFDAVVAQSAPAYSA